MFREESRFQTKKRGAGEGGGKRRGDTNKCHFGGGIKGQAIGESSLTAAIREKMAG